MFFSLLILTGFGIFSGIAFYTKSISKPEILPLAYTHDFFLLKYNIYLVIASIFTLLIYDFITLMLINVEFEKTQSTEIVYIILFIFSSLIEACRLFTPLLGLWNNISTLEIYISKGLLFGRIMAPLSLLYSVIYSNFEDRQNVSQNIAGIIVFSLFLAGLIPVNTNLVLPTGALRIGFGNLIYILLLIIFVISILSMLIKISLNHLSFKIFWGFIFLIAGYFILIQSYNILTISTGAICLFAGTYNYLKALHNQYLWN